MAEERRELDYRSLDPAEVESLRAVEREDQSLGCWMLIAVLLGVPFAAMLVIVAWLARDHFGAVLFVAISLAVLFAAGIDLFVRVRGRLRSRAFWGGVAMGFAALAALLIAAAIVTALLLALLGT